MLLRAASALLLAHLAGLASAHMSLVTPFPRNAVDKSDPRWSGGKWYPYEPHCAHPSSPNKPGQPGWNSQVPSGCVPNGTDGWGCNCANGTGVCDVGQSCLWFSQVGVCRAARAACIRSTAALSRLSGRAFVHHQGTTIGCKIATGGPSNPNKNPCFPGCGCDETKPVNATLNDPQLRTYLLR
jgi:hypothetical protein